MDDETPKARLQLVRRPRRVEIQPEDFIEPSAQGTLFPIPRRGLLILVQFPDVSEQEFRETIEYAKPSFVVELRSSPRFDIGRMNRQLAFQVFQRQNATYLDLTSTMMGELDRDELFQNLRKFFQGGKSTFDRPVAFLINRSEADDGFVRKLIDMAGSFAPAPSVVYEVPRFMTSSAGH